MIYDHIKNIGLYKGLSPALDLALEYIENVTPEVEVGTHPLDLGVKAVVSAYETSLSVASRFRRWWKPSRMTRPRMPRVMPIAPAPIWSSARATSSWSSRMMPMSPASLPEASALL